MSKSIHLTRIRIVSIIFTMVLVVIASRLYFVQVVHGDSYSQEADRQYVQSPGHSFDRGSIFFTTKKGEPFSAATINSGFILALHPDLIEDVDKTFDVLAKHTKLDREEFFEKARKKGDPYEEVAHRIDRETADKIEALDLPGVSLHKEKWRYYPGDGLASQLLGFVSYSGDELTGAYGVERQYDSLLTHNNSGLYVNFFAEVFAGLKQVVDEDVRTGDVHLTIEPTVQMNLERQIADAQKHWGSKRVSGIVINPKTGEIYAMASTPGFDLNNYSKVDDIGIYTNPLVENLYEMGSIIKPLTVAAGLDAGAITPNTTYNDTGSLSMDKHTIYNYDKRGRGVVAMQEVLNQSLNTGVAFIVTKMGTGKFADYFKDFGIREKSGIDLPGEGEGLTDNLDSPRRIEYATASYGQGIAMNPMVTVRALAALGNGGYLITPHVTKKVEYELGIPKNVEPEKGKQVLKPETSEEITRMLVNVVDDALIGGEAALDHYTIAAKTGTAQIPGPGGKYYEDRFLHTFFGYFPAYDPEFLVFLMNEEPHGAQYASQTLTAPFQELSKFLLNYYEIEPDR